MTNVMTFVCVSVFASYDYCCEIQCNHWQSSRWLWLIRLAFVISVYKNEKEKEFVCIIRLKWMSLYRRTDGGKANRFNYRASFVIVLFLGFYDCQLRWSQHFHRTYKIKSKSPNSQKKENTQTHITPSMYIKMPMSNH